MRQQTITSDGTIIAEVPANGRVDIYEVGYIDANGREIMHARGILLDSVADRNAGPQQQYRQPAQNRGSRYGTQHQPAQNRGSRYPNQRQSVDDTNRGNRYKTEAAPVAEVVEASPYPKVNEGAVVNVIKAEIAYVNIANIPAVEANTLYSLPIVVKASCDISAMAVKFMYADSAVKSKVADVELGHALASMFNEHFKDDGVTISNYLTDKVDILEYVGNGISKDLFKTWLEKLKSIFEGKKFLAGEVIELGVYEDVLAIGTAAIAEELLAIDTLKPVEVPTNSALYKTIEKYPNIKRIKIKNLIFNVEFNNSALSIRINQLL